MSALPSSVVARVPAVPTGGLWSGNVARAWPGDSDTPLEVNGRSVYLLGIGGAGMSALARMFRARGGEVAGSDANFSDVTDALEQVGVRVQLEHSVESLPDRCDLVVSSAAIKNDHRLLAQARERGVPTLVYAQALGRLMVGRTGIAVAGTHGKSTTTAMLGVALAEAGLDPSVVVGAVCPQLGGGSRLGSDRIPTGPLAGAPGILVAEACEFNRSFHHLRPTIAVITAVEADHLDIYGTLDALVESFHAFASLLPPADQGGTLLIADKGAHKREVTAGLACSVETIGFTPGADWVVGWDPATRRTTLTRKGSGVVAEWVTPLLGEHNAVNAATAMALSLYVGAEAPRVAQSLESFKGVARRSSPLGERPVVGGAVRVYDDYGHHPTEVECTLRALRGHERLDSTKGRLICVFQPHQHSRTRFLLEEFASAFSSADLVIVPEIYFVRDSEVERHLVSSNDLVDRLRARGVDAMHVYPFEGVVNTLGNICRAGDVLVVMGAGPVDRVARGFLKAGEAGSVR